MIETLTISRDGVVLARIYGGRKWRPTATRLYNDALKGQGLGPARISSAATQGSGPRVRSYTVHFRARPARAPRDFEQPFGPFMVHVTYDNADSARKESEGEA